MRKYASVSYGMLRGQNATWLAPAEYEPGDRRIGCRWAAASKEIVVWPPFGNSMRMGANARRPSCRPLPRKAELHADSFPRSDRAKQGYHNDLSSHFGNSVLQLRTFALVALGMGWRPDRSMIVIFRNAHGLDRLLVRLRGDAALFARLRVENDAFRSMGVHPIGIITRRPGRLAKLLYSSSSKSWKASSWRLLSNASHSLAGLNRGRDYRRRAVWVNSSGE